VNLCGNAADFITTCSMMSKDCPQFASAQRGGGGGGGGGDNCLNYP
jgi:hypothetical protein